MNTTRKLICGAFLALSTFAVAAFAADPNGTWKFTAEGARGRSVEATVTLKWENNQLTGSVENRLGKADITDATFVDDQVSFTVARELRGHKFSSHYTGKVTDNAIQGTIETTGREDKSASTPWNAKRQ